MGRLLDFLRRFLVYALTYLLGFLGALAAVGAATRLETTAWMPFALGVVFLIAIGLLPPFKSIVLRLALAGFLTSGSLAAWFISEPQAASEPGERFTFWAPILASTGPALCGIVLLLLSDERKVVERVVWVWTIALVIAVWFLSYFSAYHNLTGPVQVPHPSFRFTTDFVATHTIPNRGWYQAIFFFVVTAACASLATMGRAKKAWWAFVACGIPLALALFDELRNTLEFTAHLSKRNLAMDVAVIGITAFFGFIVSSSRLERQQDERIAPNSGNNQ